MQPENHLHEIGAPVVRTNNVYVTGAKGGQLGNFLFQIATAIYYKEKYNCNIFLNRKGVPGLSFTTPKMKYLLNRQTNQYIPFDETILSKFDWYSKKTRPTEWEVLHNDYSDNKIIPSKNIFISGYCQNINLFYEYMEKIPQYLNLNDQKIIDYINSKYKNVKDSVVVGVRAGSDWGSKKLTKESYVNALRTLKDLKINTDNLLIMSDVENVWEDKFDLQEEYPAIDVVEDCITQFYLGLMCKHYILSESTFHLWVAYLGTIGNSDKKVIVFDDTDITNRPLSLDEDNWIKTSY